MMRTQDEQLPYQFGHQINTLQFILTFLDIGIDAFIFKYLNNSYSHDLSSVGHNTRFRRER